MSKEGLSQIPEEQIGDKKEEKKKPAKIITTSRGETFTKEEYEKQKKEGLEHDAWRGQE